MERYSSYKDSGEKWLGEIPGHWKLERVKHLYKTQTGFTPNTKVPEFYSDDNENVWVNISDLKSKKISDSESHISNLYIRQFNPTVVPKGSLLYSFKLSVGEVAFADKDLYTNEAIASFLPSEEIDLNFLYYSAPLFIIKNANENIYGAKILNQHLIKNALIIFPPLPEQRAIVTYLDRVTGDIDRAIEESQKMIDLLNERKQIIIQHAVTKGLNNNAKLKYSGVEWIGEVPEGWECLPLKRVLKTKMQYGANEPATSDNIEYPRYIRITDIDSCGNLKDDTFRSLEPQKADGYMLNKGDILFARSGGTVGKTFLFDSDIKACFAGYLIKATCDRTKMSPMFLYYYTQTGAYENWKNSVFIQATIQNIGADKYQMMNVPIPPVSEQNEIVQYLNLSLLPFEKAQDAEERKIALLRERKQIIINEVVTGKVKVS